MSHIIRPALPCLSNLAIAIPQSNDSSLKNEEERGCPVTIDQLLQDVETLPHAARVQVMIELGRRSQTDSELAVLLNELAQGEWYQRFLALNACFGSANASQVLAALDDPSRILRG